MDAQQSLDYCHGDDEMCLLCAGGTDLYCISRCFPNMSHRERRRQLQRVRRLKVLKLILILDSFSCCCCRRRRALATWRMRAAPPVWTCIWPEPREAVLIPPPPQMLGDALLSGMQTLLASPFDRVMLICLYLSERLKQVHGAWAEFRGNGRVVHDRSSFDADFIGD